MTNFATDALTTGARRLVEAAVNKQTETKSAILGANHWLAVLIERHAPMVEALINRNDVESIRKTAEQQIHKGDPGKPLEAGTVVSKAAERARLRGKAQALERDVAAVVLVFAGFTLAAEPQTYTPSSSSAQDADKGLPNEQPAPGQMKPTPTLDKFGKDLTRAAREGKISRLIGREDELQLIVETLCRRTKRNPVLVGPAGVGKTAIVEGLAQRIIEGKVPAAMANARLISLLPSTLVAGASVVGELEKRMRAVIDEASQEGILLFIDEIHSIIGSGGAAGSSDIASILKPSLARGELACIAATTDDEYRRFIENDAALERRFQPIRIHEVPPEQTLQILAALRAEMTPRNKVQVADDILAWLVDFGAQFMRNRHFPDKAVDLLEQCYAHAIALGKTSVQMADAQEVAQRMVGMPIALEKRLDLLQQRLSAQGILPAAAVQDLINRLQVTMRGLDLRTSRPNAVLLLSGEAARSIDALAETIASALFGAADRVVVIDFSRMVTQYDITLLIGAAPGYVGYSDSLPLHRLAQIPWCVLCFQNIDACHPSIREAVAQALANGMIIDGRGKPIYFSDTVILLTAEISLQARRSTGFLAAEDAPDEDDIYAAIEAALGGTMANQVDLFVAGVQDHSKGASQQWLEENLLGGLAERYKKQGVLLEWDASLMAWLSEQQATRWSQHDWENWVDDEFSPQVIPFLGQGKVRIRIKEGKLAVEKV